ncbi:rhodanese-like domain-containing protein [candidate division WOR-3 bacterium]|nr:rhodanese-like domain-containing protein [candidate division WOR-3 bacterium]
MFKRIFISFFVLLVIFGCTTQKQPNSQTKIEEEQIKTKGIEEKLNLSAAELKKLIDEKNEDYLLIDVRTRKEYNTGHIPTAINIPHTEIEKHINEIPEDKLIIVYCQVGGRASVAASKLKDLGYSEVINFGGINSYKYKLEK